MTTQTSPRARVNVFLSRVNSAAAAFFFGLKAMLVTAVFLFAVAAFIIPVAHHVWSYWHSVASSLQAPAPAKAAAKK